MLHTPKGASKTVAVLAPGSGYSMEMPLMKNTAEALANAGIWALRFDWGFRAETGGQPSKLLDRELVDLVAAIEHAKSMPEIRYVLLVGKSIGARIVAESIARGWIEAAGVVLLSWPLHAANNPTRPWGAAGTLDPLGSINCPCAVVVGDSDAVCQLDALQKTLADKLPAGPVDGFNRRPNWYMRIPVCLNDGTDARKPPDLHPLAAGRRIASVSREPDFLESTGPRVARQCRFGC